MSLVLQIVQDENEIVMETSDGVIRVRLIGLQVSTMSDGQRANASIAIDAPDKIAISRRQKRDEAVPLHLRR